MTSVDTAECRAWIIGMQSAQLDQKAALAVTSALLGPTPPWANGKLATSQKIWLGRTDKKWANTRRNDASWCFTNVALKWGCTTRNT